MTNGAKPVPSLNPEPASSSSPSDFVWDSLPRGLALFLGGFSLLNLMGGFRSANFDATSWWVDLRFLPFGVARLLLLVSALCLIGFAVRPPRSVWRRWLTIGSLALLGLASLANTVEFYSLVLRKTVAAGVWIPLSLFISAALALLLAACWRPYETIPHVRRSLAYPLLPGRSRKFLPVLAVCLTCGVLFPLAQMFCFGKTDYRRPADMAVVLGARVYADGHLSDALADRVRTACSLYRDGLVRKLLFSGGPGDGAVHETEAMKRLAVRLGVNAGDILVDEAGLNTQATVKNSEAVFSALRASRILVVSHFYHLPRIKLAYQREGWAVYTVPAKESYLLRQMPYNMLREVAALWVYYLRPLAA